MGFLNSLIGLFHSPRNGLLAGNKRETAALEPESSSRVKRTREDPRQHLDMTDARADGENGRTLQPGDAPETLNAAGFHFSEHRKPGQNIVAGSLRAMPTPGGQVHRLFQPVSAPCFFRLFPE
jgi:hypothetical protein